jgi:hypothetical protein
MILSSIGIIASGGKSASFDADYQKILTLSSTAGYTLPSAGQQIKQNDLVLALKAGGIWSKLDTFALFANDVNISNPIPNPYNNAFALVDWIRTANTNTLVTYTAVNSPTWSSNGGFKGNGTSAYINTNFNPATPNVNYKLDNAGRFFWIDDRGANIYLEGGLTTAFNNNTLNSNSSNHRINSGTNGLNSSVNFAVDGYKAVNRTSSTNVEVFTGTTQFNRTATSTAILSQNQSVLGGLGGQFSTARFRFYAMGSSLVSENTAFYNAINTYMTSL